MSATPFRYDTTTLSDAHSENSNGATPGRLLILGLLIAATALSVARQGYGLAYKNQAYQLPLVLGMTRDANFAGDPFVQSLDSYASPFLFGLRELLRFAPVAPTYFVLFLVVRLALLASLARLAWVTTGDRRVAAFVVAVGVARMDSLSGAETVFSEYLSHTVAAYPLLILSLSFLIEGRLGASAVAGVLGACVNPLTAAYSLFAFTIALLAPAAPRGGLRWGAVVRWGALVAALAAPLAFWVLERVRPVGPDADWVPLAQALLPFHLMPTKFGAFTWAKTIGFAAIALALARPVRDSPRHRTLAAIVPAAGVLTVLGWLFAEVWPIPFAMQLHLPRSSALVTVVAEVFIAHYLICEHPRRSSVAWASLILAATILSGTKMLLIAWIPFGIDWLSARGIQVQPGGRARVVWLTIAGAIAAMALGRFVIDGAPTDGVSISVLVLALSPLVHLVSAPRGVSARRARASDSAAAGARRSRRPLALAATTAPALPVLFVVLATGLAVSRTVEMVSHRGLLEPHDEWAQVQRWAARSTPPGSVFLTPPLSAGFRSLSRRSSFVDLKDGCALLWEPTCAGEWLRRIGALGVPRDVAFGGERDGLARALEHSFRSLDAPALARLSAAEGIDFVVRDRALDDKSRASVARLPIVYENEGFVVRDLRGMRGAEPGAAPSR